MDLLSSVASTRPVASSEATYSCTLTNTWSGATHPVGYEAIRSSAHWSPPVVVVHNQLYDLWRPKFKASEGVKLLAEMGLTDKLVQELKAASQTTGRYVKEWTIGKNQFNSVGIPQVLGDVTLTQDFPYLSSITMVAPSPDWFSGFPKVSPIENTDGVGFWFESFSIATFPWDAGTEAGEAYSTSNPDQDPRAPITQLTAETVPSSGILLDPTGEKVLPMATWSCELRPLPSEQDEDQDEEAEGPGDRIDLPEGTGDPQGENEDSESESDGEGEVSPPGQDGTDPQVLDEKEDDGGDAPPATDGEDPGESEEPDQKPPGVGVGVEDDVENENENTTETGDNEPVNQPTNPTPPTLDVPTNCLRYFFSCQSNGECCSGSCDPRSNRCSSIGGRQSERSESKRLSNQGGIVMGGSAGRTFRRSGILGRTHGRGSGRSLLPDPAEAVGEAKAEAEATRGLRGRA